MSRRSRQRFRVGPFALAVLALASACAACLWDSDTLRQEATGAPGVVDVIVGRLDRNPPLYYEMRLERVAALLDAEPESLGAYDDAGVACDRLGRHDEAIAGMERKRDHLDALAAAGGGEGGELAEHEYRYHANLGTFLAHRWVAGGADRDAMDDLRRGRDHIARAIDLNPEAHFGRERYQLLFMEWMLEPPEAPHADYAAPHVFGEIKDGLSMAGDVLSEAGYDDAVEGLSGLITLGAAWESVDVYIALGVALGDRGHSSMARLAKLRAMELIGNGRQSMHPSARADPASLGSYLATAMISSEGMPRDEDALAEFFAEARASADERHAQRTAYMLARLERGEHPDTHEDFWDEWVEPRAPAMPGLMNHNQKRTLTVAAVLGGLVVTAVGVPLRRRRRARRAALAETLPLGE